MLINANESCVKEDEICSSYHCQIRREAEADKEFFAIDASKVVPGVLGVATLVFSALTTVWMPFNGTPSPQQLTSKTTWYLLQHHINSNLVLKNIKNTPCFLFFYFREQASLRHRLFIRAQSAFSQKKSPGIFNY